MADDRTQPATPVRNPTTAGDPPPPDEYTRPTDGHRTALAFDLPAVPGYDVTGEIARGGMGRVLAARDRSFDRDVAVKVLLPAADPAAAARRFVREARVTGRLAHPNIPPAHHLGTLADGSPFLAMKLVRGDTLAALLAARPDPGHDLPRFVGVFEQVCQAAGYAHSQGVVHRDLKPANVMVGQFGEVQVMDWGIAVEKDGGGRVRDDARPDPGVARGHPPSPSRPEGTPAYMAPEQARDEPVDARADVFALGGVLCAVLVGRPPFRGADTEATLARAAAGDTAEALAALDRCAAEAELVGVARRCLAADPAARPADGTAVARLVAAYRAGVEERLRRAERDRAAADARVAEQRKRWRVQLALGAAVVVMVAGLGAAGVWRAREESDRRAAESDRKAAESARRARAAEGVATLLDQAAAALAAGDADRADPFLAQAARRAADDGVGDHAARLAALRRDLGMLRTLDEVDAYRWTPRESNFPAARAVVGRWAAAFAGYGLAPGAAPPAEAAARVAGSPIRAALVAALDGWLARDPDEAVRAVLDAADPDPFRADVRRLLAAGDRAGLAALAGRPEWDRQPSSLIEAFAGVGAVPPPAVRALLTRVAAGRADDFAVLMVLGSTYPVNTPDGAADRLRWFQAAAAVRPRNPAAWHNLGVALANHGDPAGAAAAYREAARLAPALAAPHNGLGNARRAAGDLPGAVAAYREAVRLDPAFAAAHNNLGLALAEGGDPAAAAAAHREAARLAPADPDPHNNLGNALRAAGDLPGAVAAYRAAIRLGPALAAPHNGLGNALRAAGDLPGAVAAYREAIRLDPALAAAHNNLGNALRAAGDPTGAEAAFREAIRLEPGNATAHNNLGLVRRDRGDAAGAAACYREALRLDPGLAVVHNNLGVLLEEALDLAAAEAAYREAARLSPRFAGALANLGEACRKQGKAAEAAAAYRAALELQPTIGYARDGLAFVERVLRGEVPTAPPPRPAARAP